MQGRYFVSTILHFVSRFFHHIVLFLLRTIRIYIGKATAETVSYSLIKSLLSSLFIIKLFGHLEADRRK